MKKLALAALALTVTTAAHATETNLVAYCNNGKQTVTLDDVARTIMLNSGRDPRDIYHGAVLSENSIELHEERNGRLITI